MYGGPIGHLIGLGDAEFRLLVLARATFGTFMSLVSSLLGVAGGELIIPTLAFAFGADIKTAGSPCPLVSLPTVAGGLMVGLVPAVAIKLVLGVILIFSRS